MSDATIPKQPFRLRISHAHWGIVLLLCVPLVFLMFKVAQTRPKLPVSSYEVPAELQFIFGKRNPNPHLKSELLWTVWPPTESSPEKMYSATCDKFEIGIIIEKQQKFADPKLFEPPSGLVNIGWYLGKYKIVVTPKEPKDGQKLLNAMNELAREQAVLSGS